MERKYVCANGVVERTRYAVGDNAVVRKRKRKGNTSFRKQEANFNTAVRRLARILNCNYSHENGLLLTLDYSGDGLEKLIKGLPEAQQGAIRSMMLPVGQVGSWKSVKVGKNGRQVAAPTGAEVVGVGRTGSSAPTGACAEGINGADEDETKVEALEALREASEHQFELWLRRIKRKHGGEVKFVSVTSDLDGDTGEMVRVHHHVVLAAEGISWDLLRNEWKLGGMDIRQLRHNADYTPIALYLMRQVRRRPDAKKYRVSRGMVQPEITEREILGNVQMRVPAGAKLLEASEYTVDSVGQYMRYIPKKRNWQGGGGDGNGI